MTTETHMEQNSEGKKSSSARGLFWKIVVSVLLALVVLNIYNGVALKKVEIPGLFNVEFAGHSDANPHSETQPSAVTPASTTPPAQLASVAPVHRPRPEPAMPNLSGQWDSNQGTTYQIQHYNEQITLTEINPLLGVTAEGTGTITGRNIVLQYATAFGTTGTARLTVEDEGDTLTGVFRDNVTNASSAIELYR
ncbi:hypothetical protein MNBD_GAMMA15-1876 [hydrothermal vent metagenome]|uniref:Uncharacterized protein n=1 Tax=hydrothermal vent metagenome TaxID=652676 RepID=A0A3B0Y8L2_9ZZZZ